MYYKIRWKHLDNFKGHILTYDDLIVRRHILNLICKGETGVDADTPISTSLSEGLKRLPSLADDELVELESSKLKATPLGKRFLRNICMALDARLWA